MTHTRAAQVARAYTAEDWRELKLGAEGTPPNAWSKGIDIFEDRMRSRFFEPVDALIDMDNDKCEQTYGFAILAIDCLVIETLQAFREGVVRHHGKSQRLFTSFLRGWNAFAECLKGEDATKLSDRVYFDCRCALLHSGATDGDLRVGKTGPTFRFRDGHVDWINRTELHQRLVREFERYVAELRTGANAAQRRDFRMVSGPEWGRAQA